MKKRTLLSLFLPLLVLVLALIHVPASAAPGDVAINESNFPDPVFRNYVATALDSNDDDILSPTEIANIADIDVAGLQINSLGGIEYFTALESLFCPNNNLTTLDLSGLSALASFSYDKDKLTSLDLSGCTSLENLDCSNGPLTSLDLSGCTALKSLRCDNNNLTTLDLSGLSALASFSYDKDKLTSLNLTGCTSLENLSITGGKLTALNMSSCTSLVSLRCDSNNLTALDLSGCTALTELYCYNNDLTTLDLSGLSALESIEYDKDKLTSLNFTGCSALESLNVTNGKLTALNTSSCASLVSLHCNNNNLTFLDLSGCANLTELYCNNNQLDELAVLDCTNLSKLDCSNNLLTQLDLTNCVGLTYDDLAYSYNNITKLVTPTGSITDTVLLQPQKDTGYISVIGLANSVPRELTHGVPVTLPTQVYPLNATAQNVKWTINPAASTGTATLSGSTITGITEGRINLMLSVENGLSPGVPFEYNYIINVAISTNPAPGPSGEGITQPSIDGSSGWKSITDKASALTDGDVLVINMGGTKEVPGSFFDSISGKNVDISFDMGLGFMWTVNGLNIPSSNSNINLGVTIGGSAVDALVRNIGGTMSYVQLNIAHNGALPFAMTLSVKLDIINAGYISNLYYFNEEIKTLEFKQASDINADGITVFAFDHASVYAIVVDEVSHESAAWTNPFSDVKEIDWFYSDVEYVVQKGLFNGTSATTFSPQMPMTRGMAVTVLGRLAGIDVADYSGESFNDVDVTQYYAPYVKWASMLGIVNGVGGNRFAPNANISRQDLAVILAQYAQAMELNMKQTLQNVVFTDSNDIASYAVDAVGNMVRAGVINGRDTGSFDPGANATRAEVAAMLHRFCEAVQS